VGQDHVAELILIDVILLKKLDYKNIQSVCLDNSHDAYMFFAEKNRLSIVKTIKNIVAARHPLYINAHVRASLLLPFHIVAPMFFLFARRVSRIRRPRQAHNLARTSAGCHFNCPMIGSGYRSACPSISRTIGLPEISFLPVRRTHRFQLIL